MSTAIERTPIQRKDRAAGAGPNNALTGIGFEAYLYNWAMYIRGEQDYGRQLTQAAVTMHIRARCVVISDLVSGYGTRADTEGRWMQYDPNLDGESHPINIVGPAITTNKNACLQSNAEVEVRSANASAEHKQIAQRWQAIADFVERTTWDESKRGFIFDDTQKGGTDLVDTFPELKDKQSVPRAREGMTALTVYQCEACGASGMTQGDADDAEEISETTIECPQCGQEAAALSHPLPGMEMEEDEVPVYEIKDRVIPSFNFTIDTYGAKVGGLKTAQWLQIQDLRDLMWLLTHYPNMSYTGPTTWSYPLRCDYALSRGRWQYLNQQPRESAWGSGHERYEVKTIYLHEEAYAAYRAPSDYEFVNAEGELTFRIKKGQTIGEAQKALFGENFHGFKFVWQEERLLDIPLPTKEEVNLRNRFGDVHWSRESGSYLSSPNYSIVFIQDDLTLLNTLNHNIIARNAVNPVFFDSTVFEKGDFSNEFIGTKNAALLSADPDLRKYVTQLPVPTPTPYLAQQMQWLFEIKDSVSMVQPAMRGEAQKGAPYAAQRLQVEQSYGNLTSVLKSFAQCKCTIFLAKARLIKRFWTLEQFQRVASIQGEIWTEEDVEEMCEIDFDTDLTVTYREGSEMPSSPQTREMKFFGALQQLIPLVAAGVPVEPDKMQQIVQKIDEFGEFDFDLTGLEVNEMIAQKRFNDLARLCLPAQNVTWEQIQQMKQTVVGQEPPTEQAIQQSIQIAQSAPDDPQAMAQAQQLASPTPITQYDVIVQKVFEEAGIHFSQYEDLPQQQAYYVEMLRAEIGKTKPNLMLIQMMEFLLQGLDQALGHLQDQQMAKDPAVQAAAAADAATAEDRNKELALKQGELQLKDKALGLQEQEIGIKATQADRDALIDLTKHVSTQEQADEHKAMDVSAAEKAAKTEKSKPKTAKGK